MKPALHLASCAMRDVRSALAGGIARLDADAAPSAALAAELLLMHVLGRGRSWLYAHPEYELAAGEAAAYTRLLDQRASGIPLQHLTGRQEFWGLEFEVTSSVLIPRPETEHIIEVVLDRLGARRPSFRNEPLRIADVGTGSGCLAVALAHELPQARVVATDVSAAALEVAHRNAVRHGVAGRIEFYEMSLLDSYLASAIPAQRHFDKDVERHFDLIVSNPPYIARSEAAQLPREVHEHEPPEALFGGEQGCELYAPLFAQARVLLRAGGLLVVEVGFGGAAHVRSLLDASEWSGISTALDLAGIERIVSAERSA